MLRSSILVFSLVWMSLCMTSCLDTTKEVLPEQTKVALRSVGHRLLFSNNDSTSRVLPIVELEGLKYELSFEEQISFDPDVLVAIIDSAFLKSQLPKHYRVEVIQRSDKEIAYSYEMDAAEQHTIIPCGGRLLPKNEYIIEVDFNTSSNSIYTSLILLSVLLLGVLLFLRLKKNPVPSGVEVNREHKAIGSFKFYPEQNKLVKQAIEINLSKKECELLEIFVASPNQIIKRDELTKRVWEDNGVFVGRSLDTYISKLRKKLKDDDTIKLTNVHGIGYKLELK